MADNVEVKYIKHIQLDPNDDSKKYQIKDIEAPHEPIEDTTIDNLFSKTKEANN